MFDIIKGRQTHLRKDFRKLKKLIDENGSLQEIGDLAGDLRRAAEQDAEDHSGFGNISRQFSGFAKEMFEIEKRARFPDIFAREKKKIKEALKKAPGRLDEIRENADDLVKEAKRLKRQIA